MRPLLAFVLTLALAGSAAAQEAVAAETPPEPEAVLEAETAEAELEAETAETVAEEPGTPALAVLDAKDVSLADFQWIARPIVVFANTPADPRFQQQMEKLLARPGPLIERDVVVITDTDPAARSDIRLALRPREFMLVLIAKDGTVNLRKPFPWDVRELSRAIDKMPLRQQEMRDANRPGG